MKKDKQQQSTIDIYMSRVFKFVLITLSLVAVSAGATLSIIKLLGFYASVNWTALLIFDGTTILYLLLAIWLVTHCENAFGGVKPSILFSSKVFIFLVEVIQWNFISYMIPSRDFWAYSVFFVMLVVLLLDHKFVLLVEAEILISMIVSWIVNGSELLPVEDDLFVPNLILRFVFVTLSFFCLWLIAFLVKKQLVSELEKVADYDTLTLIPNRRNLDYYLDNLMKKSEQFYSDFTVFMCDIDDFKIVNDTYGHDVGDEVLKHVAGIMTRCAGDKGRVFRFGGEEFVVIVDAMEKEALEVAERIRDNIEHSPVLLEDSSISITITIGGATYIKGVNTEELIKMADDRMYFGKKHGKNQVVI